MEISDDEVIEPADLIEKENQMQQLIHENLNVIDLEPQGDEYPQIPVIPMDEEKPAMKKRKKRKQKTNIEEAKESEIP